MARSDPDGSLRRLGGGRWQTRDERFTIEPQSGTWVVVDAEQTDELGLSLVRGPFASLGAAKEGIATAREARPATSPLAARVAKLRHKPAEKSADDDDGARKGSSSRREKAADAKRAATRTRPERPGKRGRTVRPEQPAEPRWLQALDPAERRRASRLIDRLHEAGAPDPEGIARRDIVGEVPAAAAFAIARAIEALGDDASPAKIAELLASGRDDELGVRWHLADDRDRPILVDLALLRAR